MPVKDWHVNLAFSNPVLERQFRDYVYQRKNLENGGFLICSGVPRTWPTKFSWREWVKAVESEYWLEPHRFRFIEQVIVLPNTSTTPERTWNTWNIDQALAVAKANELLHGGMAIHWHNHPYGSDGDPSKSDAAFAGAYLRESKFYSLMAIVTTYPLRVVAYSFEYGRAGLPPSEKAQSINRGGFLSWHTDVLKKFLPKEK